jgi:hypothetical protein
MTGGNNGGNKKQQCITADSRILLLQTILKRKTLQKVNVKGVIIQTQESRWMDLLDKTHEAELSRSSLKCP